MNTTLLRFNTISPDKKTLICFTFAGSGANYYRQWAKSLSEINVMAIQLPGRETRLREKRVTDFVSLVDQLANLINSQISAEIAIFGHSLGGMLGFAVCQTLQKKYGRYVETLFISGRCPPEYKAVRLEDIRTDSDLIGFLKRVGGAPDDILKNKEMMKVYLPIVRDDLVLNDNSSLFNFEIIDSPIVTFSGERDLLASPANMATWYRYTSQECSSNIYGGDHFFINEYYENIHEIIMDSLNISLSA